MRKNYAPVLVFVMMAMASLVVASSQEPAKPSQDKAAAEKPAAYAQPSPEDMKKMMEGMKKWMDSIQPGKHHEPLNQFVGKWDTVTRMWMGGPGSQPSESKGTSEVKWVLGKRFILEEHKGEMLMPDPSGAMKKVPYEGMGTWGYDNIRNLYAGTWASTAGTNLQTMTGAADPGGKLFRLYGEMDEPMLDVYGRMVKFENKIESEDRHVLTIYDLHAGDDYRVVEITYTRKK
jgi:hypothetical protein